MSAKDGIEDKKVTELYVTMEANVEKVDEIFKELKEAKEEIFECYCKLGTLEVISIKGTANEDSPKE